MIIFAIVPSVATARRRGVGPWGPLECIRGPVRRPFLSIPARRREISGTVEQAFIPRMPRAYRVGRAATSRDVQDIRRVAGVDRRRRQESELVGNRFNSLPL